MRALLPVVSCRKVNVTNKQTNSYWGEGRREEGGVRWGGYLIYPHPLLYLVAPHAGEEEWYTTTREEEEEKRWHTQHPLMNTPSYPSSQALLLVCSPCLTSPLFFSSSSSSLLSFFSSSLLNTHLLSPLSLTSSLPPLSSSSHITGLIADGIMHPIDTIRARLQTQVLTIKHIFIYIYIYQHQS